MQDRIADKPFYQRVPWISVELTNHCNLRCAFCGNRNMTRPRGYMSWELLEKVVAECRQKKYTIMTLHGAGEPLLYPRLEEAVRLVKDNTGFANFSTNGVLMNAEKVRKLLNAGLDSIHISLDSLNPKIYAETRGAELAKVVENIRNLIHLAPATVNIYISLMSSKFQVLTGRDNQVFSETFGTHANVALQRNEYDFFPVADEDFSADPGTGKLTWCALPACFFPVMWDGRVALCCLDQDVQHPLGDLNRDSIEEVWFDPRNQEALYKLALGERGCPDYCLEKCTVVNIDPAIPELPDSEIEAWRAKKLLEIASGLEDLWIRQGIKAEVFAQRAMEIAPDNREVREMFKRFCKEHPPARKNYRRFLKPLKKFASSWLGN